MPRLCLLGIACLLLAACTPGPARGVSTLAGGGKIGPLGGGYADGPADAARFFGPEGLAVDSRGVTTAPEPPPPLSCPIASTSTATATCT